MILSTNVREPPIFWLADVTDRTALDRSFVSDDDALATRDQTDPSDDTGAGEFVFHAYAGKRGDLQKVRAFVEQHLYAVARQQTSTGEMPFDVLFAASFRRASELSLQFPDCGRVCSVVSLVGLITRVDDRFDR